MVHGKEMRCMNNAFFSTLAEISRETPMSCTQKD